MSPPFRGEADPAGVLEQPAYLALDHATLRDMRWILRDDRLCVPARPTVVEAVCTGILVATLPAKARVGSLGQGLGQESRGRWEGRD